MRVAIKDQIAAGILACGQALCLLGEPLNIRERAEITSGLAARQTFRLHDRRFVGPYFYCLKKHKIDQALSFENGFRPSFWSRGQTNSWKSQSPPPGGLPRRLNISIVAARR